jgi:uncharacterized membrane protein
MLEDNFYVPLLTRRLISPMKGWSESLAIDLDQPKFKTTYFQAIGFRLYRNYAWIFLILVLGWLLKLFIHPTEATGVRMLYERMAVGAIPPWLVLAFGVTFCAIIAAALIAAHRVGMPVDEIKGLERDLALWKI